MTSPDLRVRMAPSPTGLLHIGTARTTLYNWLLARHSGGTFVLRIEDSDQSRSRPEHTANILDAIRWMGLDWDEGPEVGGPCGPYFQSQKRPRYQEVAQALAARELAYRCYCTPEELAARRKEMEKAGQAPKYDRRCLQLTEEERARFEAEGRPHALRFRVPDEGTVGWADRIRGEVSFENRLLDDFVLVKADGFPTYLLAVVVDDYDMRITLILRGDDIISATPRQLHIYAAMGWETPEFAHVPMILAPDRSKLSKRHGATGLTEYRDMGYLPEAIVNFIALLGWAPGDDREIMTREEMTEAFTIEGIGKSGAAFDLEKLNWMNGYYLRQLTLEQFVEKARPFLGKAGLLADNPSDEYVTRVLKLEQERAKTLGEVPGLVEFFFREPESYEEKGAAKWFRREGAAELLKAARETLAGLDDFSHGGIETAIRGLAEVRGEKVGPIIHTTRLAVTGLTAGPGLFELLALLGKERVTARLQRAEEYVASL